MKAIQNQLDTGRNSKFVKFLGRGALRWVSTGCIATVVLSITLGLVAGHHAAAKGFGGLAVVASSAFSLAIGYLIVVVAFHHTNRVPFLQLLPEGSNSVLAASFASAFILLPALSAVCARFPAWRSNITATGVALLLAGVLIPVWLHPMRKRILRWVFSRVPA